MTLEGNGAFEIISGFSKQCGTPAPTRGISLPDEVNYSVSVLSRTILFEDVLKTFLKRKRSHHQLPSCKGDFLSRIFIKVNISLLLNLINHLYVRYMIVKVYNVRDYNKFLPF